MTKENRTEVCCSLPPGTATVVWRADRIVAVRLGRRALAGPSDNGACHALLSALDRGAAAAGLQYDLGSLPEFTRKVLRLCSRIPSGSVRTYGQLAVAAGRPGAARSVGQAMAANPLPLVIPCHRVVRSGGFIGGYTGGTAWKEFLLGREGWTLTGKGRTRRLAAWPGEPAGSAEKPETRMTNEK
jgi:methylated-DNA-[protein]-cysteine S-methyltransferase